MEEQQEQLYAKGFNNGYLLAKHDPKLATLLATQGNEQNPYYNGLVGGKQEYEKEVNEWAKSFAKNPPAKEDRDLDKER